MMNAFAVLLLCLQLCARVVFAPQAYILHIFCVNVCVLGVAVCVTITTRIVLLDSAGVRPPQLDYRRRRGAHLGDPIQFSTQVRRTM